jgi:hypothetical protein
MWFLTLKIKSLKKFKVIFYVATDFANVGANLVVALSTRPGTVHP